MTFERSCQILTAALIGVLLGYLLLVADSIYWIANKLHIDLIEGWN